MRDHSKLNPLSLSNRLGFFGNQDLSPFDPKIIEIVSFFEYETGEQGTAE